MIHIIKSTQHSGYWVNGKYILPENYEISKHNFTMAEQKAFENFLINDIEVIEPITIK